jgi:hypothetical protein
VQFEQGVRPGLAYNQTTGWHLAVSGGFLQEKIVDLKHLYFFNIPLQP